MDLALLVVLVVALMVLGTVFVLWLVRHRRLNDPKELRYRELMANMAEREGPMEAMAEM